MAAGLMVGTIGSTATATAAAKRAVRESAKKRLASIEEHAAVGRDIVVDPFCFSFRHFNDDPDYTGAKGSLSIAKFEAEINKLYQPGLLRRAQLYELDVGPRPSSSSSSSSWSLAHMSDRALRLMLRFASPSQVAAVETLSSRLAKVARMAACEFAKDMHGPNFKAVIAEPADPKDPKSFESNQTHGP